MPTNDFAIGLLDHIRWAEPITRDDLRQALGDETLVPRLTSAELRERIDHESVGKGMIPKLRACADAVDQGVNFAHIIDGRVRHSLLIELLTDHGVGTMIRREKSW